MNFNALFPELIVSQIDQSKHFYVDVLGFVIAYSRPEERFLFLSYGEAQVMLLQDNDNQHSRTGSLDYPRGQGVNFSILTENAERLADRLKRHNVPLRIPMRDQWHRQNDIEHGERQLWVMDPDGYLLRFIQKLGTRPSVTKNSQQ